MNSSSGKGSMSTESSSAAGWKSGDVVPDQFPAGLRVLAVDDDRTCLVILEKMLRTCLYEVKTCERAMTALSMLRENKNWFDIVISDVHMPDMDGFKLLEHIGLEMDLPVIMMSADDGKHVVMKGVTHGACDYLIKPVRIEALKNIWQHVVRKRRNEWKDFEQLGSVEEGDRQPKESDDADYSSVANEVNWKSSKKRKYDSDETNERDDTSTLKKPRVVWSVELHQQFVAAVNQLGIDIAYNYQQTLKVSKPMPRGLRRGVSDAGIYLTRAVPKKILELMNIPGLTRENVASHLQKYRLYLRRLSGVPLHQSNLNDSFVSSQEATFGTLSSLNGLDVQTLAATGRVPAQSPAAFQAAGLGRSAAKAGVPMTLVDQRNSFSFENPKLIFREGLQQHTNTNKQMNLLNGIPTTMEPKQLAGLHHAAQSIGNINMQVTSSNGTQSSRNGSLSIRMAQPRSRGQMLDDSTIGHALRLPSSIGQPILSNGIPENMRTAGHNPVSQTSLMLNFPVNHSSELPGNSFPLGSTPGMSSLTSKENSQEDINSENEGVGGFMPGYEIFNDLDQHKFENWELQNVVMTFDASQHSNSHQGNLDLVQSVLVQQGFSSVQVNGHNGNAAVVSKAIMFSAGDIPKPENAQNVNQHLDSLLVDNTITVKSERVVDASPANLFPDHIRQEDVMSAVLKQREGISLAENEFDFNGYSMDNPV